MISGLWGPYGYQKPEIRTTWTLRGHLEVMLLWRRLSASDASGRVRVAGSLYIEDRVLGQSGLGFGVRDGIWQAFGMI